jgi:hypothetical protein
MLKDAAWKEKVASGSVIPLCTALYVCTLFLWKASGKSSSVAQMKVSGVLGVQRYVQVWVLVRPNTTK